MALETKCLTPEAVFHTNIGTHYISMRVALPFELKVSKEEAEVLERLLHNQVELVLRPYFAERNWEWLITK
tara:strand:- start:733 stop:945 length:213 start_codon:yes stop_codon:yes gene_type:complete